MIICHAGMRESPIQPGLWSPPNESMYKSPGYFNTRNQPPHPQAHHNLRATGYNYPPPHHVDHTAEALMLGDDWPQQTGPNLTTIAPPTHVQYVDYGYTQHSHDRLNIRLSAPPPLFESASVASSSTQPISPRPSLKSQQNTQSLPDNKTNLEKMRHERESIFQRAATELNQVRCDTGSAASTNKAWEDAWEVLRESMTRM
jgi:hypothetical protein